MYCTYIVDVDPASTPKWCKVNRTLVSFYTALPTSPSCHALHLPKTLISYTPPYNDKISDTPAQMHTHNKLLDIQFPTPCFQCFRTSPSPPLPPVSVPVQSRIGIYRERGLRPFRSALLEDPVDFSW